LTIPKLLQVRVQRDAHRAAVACGAASLDYSGLDRESVRIATSLVGAGVVKGTRVGLIMSNGVDWVVAALAVMRIGAVLVPLATDCEAQVREQQLRSAAVSFLICKDAAGGDDLRGALGKIAPRGADHFGGRIMATTLPSLRMILDWEQLNDAANDIDSDAARLVVPLGERVTAADDIAILFASQPPGARGVIHTHGNALRAVAAALAGGGLNAAEKIFAAMPFFQLAGFAGGLLTALASGTRLETLGETDGNIGASTSPSTFFWATETFGPYCSLDRGLRGQPLDGIEVRVVDAVGRGVPMKEAGVIKVRGANVMRGICGVRREQVFDRDGFCATRDLGYLDAEGYVNLVRGADAAFAANESSADVWNQ
jgi:acyl-CoA synthetase (AMP-forming)/AMP-acid ligase II